MTRKVESGKLAEGLCLYILQLDPMRPPAPIGATQYSINVLFKLLFFSGPRNYFFRNRSDLYRKTKAEMDNFYKNIGNLGNKEKKIESVIYLIFIFLVITISFLISILYHLTLINTLLVTTIITSITLYLLIVLISTRRRRILGEKYDQDIKKAVQLLINYGTELVHEAELNPADFPLKLRHNDSDGLIYEKKGENDYVGFFEK